MIILISLIFFVFYPMNTYQSQLISVRISKFFGSFYIQIPIGRPIQIMMEALNQELDYSWTISQYFDIKKSQTLQIMNNSIVHYYFNTFDALEVQDILRFPETEDTAIYFKFKTVNNLTEISNSIGGFGFLFKYLDKSYSIIHALKKASIINDLSYAITFNKTDYLLFFGGIPETYTKNMQNGSCKVNPNQSKWSCNLSKIVILKGNTTLIFNNTIYSFFQARDQNIQAPLSFYHYLKETVLQNEMITKDCQEIESPSVKYLLCNNQVISKLSSISFQFENLELSLGVDVLIDDFANKKIILIMNKNDQNDKWVFGSLFLMQYQTLFDYDKETITFYAKNGVKLLQNQLQSKNKSSFSLKMIYLICLCFLIIGITVLSLSIHKYKQCLKT